jgi:hypothetical protein
VSALDFSPSTSVVMALALAVGVAVMLRSAFRAAHAHRYGPRRLQTSNEEEFFGRLRRAVPELHVFPQVALSALVDAKGSSNRDRLVAFRRISQKRVDWAVCGQDLGVVCVVELDDATHEARRDAERDRILRSAGIPCIRWPSKGRPNTADVRSRIMELCRPNDVMRQPGTNR